MKPYTTSEIITLIKSMINCRIEQFKSDENKTKLLLSNPLDGLSKRRLTALGFEIENLCATYTGDLTRCIILLAQKVSFSFNGSSVEDVKIDNEFFNVTATINGTTNVDCDWLENFG